MNFLRCCYLLLTSSSLLKNKTITEKVILDRDVAEPFNKFNKVVLTNRSIFR